MSEPSSLGRLLHGPLAARRIGSRRHMTTSVMTTVVNPKPLAGVPVNSRYKHGGIDILMWFENVRNRLGCLPVTF
jgi:hypothetical protein